MDFCDSPFFSSSHFRAQSCILFPTVLISALAKLFFNCKLFQVADNFYRPDLKKAALARLSVVHRSLKVSKSGVKKRNRQAVKTPGRK